MEAEAVSGHCILIQLCQLQLRVWPGMHIPRGILVSGQMVNEHHAKRITQKVHCGATPVQQPIQRQNHRQIRSKPVQRHGLRRQKYVSYEAGGVFYAVQEFPSLVWLYVALDMPNRAVPNLSGIPCLGDIKVGIASSVQCGGTRLNMIDVWARYELCMQSECLKLACKTISMVTRPAEGMAAAPMAASVAVTATTIVPPKPRVTPCACQAKECRAEDRTSVMGPRTCIGVESPAIFSILHLCKLLYKILRGSKIE